MTKQLPHLTYKTIVDTLGPVALRHEGSELEKIALAQTVEHAAFKAERQNALILELPAGATDSELNNARRYRAVRRGKDVFLPRWHELCCALPNLLMRSALWSISSIRDDSPVNANDGESGERCVYVDQEIASTNDVRIIYQGPALGTYDRRVFATCLSYYREERPLSSKAEQKWVEVSFFKFLEEMGVKYHPDSLEALRKSLLRLSKMVLRMRCDGLDIQVPRILDVSFAGDVARGEEGRASDKIVFRVLEEFAQLYGEKKWTAVPLEALREKVAIKSWLGSFYSTHAKPFPIELESLHKMTGSSATLPKFKYDLKNSLDSMKLLSQPDSTRVKDYKLGSSTVVVEMQAWEKRNSRKSGSKV
nr:plasmid replication initiator TrfA [Variovorax boronicumulans]